MVGCPGRCHMCRWVSIMPGMRIPLLASITTASSGAVMWRPTSAIVSPTTRTSPPSMMPAPSIVKTVPPRNTIGRPGSGAALGLSGLITVHLIVEENGLACLPSVARGPAEHGRQRLPQPLACCRVGGGRPRMPRGDVEIGPDQQQATVVDLAQLGPGGVRGVERLGTK